jgi:LemA protein
VIPQGTEAGRRIPRPAYFLGAVTLVLVAAAGWAAGTYNHLVRASFAVDTQWAQVEVQYQRRVDLIPRLVAAVQGVLVQERTVFDALARARAAYLAAPAGSESRVRAAETLRQPLGRLLAIIEASPTLRSSETVAGLLDELAGTENRIAVERRRYNERVRAYNTLVLQFPSSLIASSAGFRPRPYFEASPEAGAPPAVTLSSP